MAGSFAGRWSGLQAGQRFLFGGVLAGAVLTVVVSVLIMKHVSYGMLFTNLDAEQASPVVEKLREKNIDYKLTNGGRTILVPEKDVYQLRLELAGEVPQGGGGGGYELFDRSKFGLTNFMEQVTSRRALEGELARTIGSLDEVLTARIHLVMPERSVFTDDKRAPSASVVLRLKPGASLGQKQVQGIAALTAGAVEGLTTENVSIVDAAGNLLTSQDAGRGLDPVAAARYEAENEVARSLEERAQSLLEQVVGAHNSGVRVFAELDFDKLERDSETYDPEKSAIRSEQSSEQAGADASGESSTSLTNYEINKTVEHVKKAPGAIKRLSVAVTVNGRYEPLGPRAPKGAQPRFLQRPKPELDNLAALVRNAVGVDETRGDSFHIACVEFDRSGDNELQVVAAQEQRREMVQTVAGKGSIVIAAIIVFLALKIAFGSMAKVLAGQGQPRAALAGAGPGGRGRGMAAGESGSLVDFDLPAVNPPRNMAVNPNASAISKRPEQAADLISQMLEEDR